MDIKFLVRFETYNSVLVQVSFQYTLLYILLKVQYGPQRCHGIGLSDGETMERLWSYLRRFNRMTKEMRPSHRVDVLTSALTYYGIKTKDKLSEFNLYSVFISLIGITLLVPLLLMRWDRAVKIKLLSEEMLIELMPSFFQGKRPG